MSRKKAIYLLESEHFERIYGPGEQVRVSEMVDIVAPLQTPDSIRKDPSVLRDVEIIMSGWGMAAVDDAFIQAAPCLKAIFYGAGSVKGFAERALAEGIRVTSSYAANGIPVAEYCVANIVLGLKQFLPQARKSHAARSWGGGVPVAGGYQSTVGLVSLGMVGRHVLQLLRSYDVRIAVYCITMNDERAREMGVRNCSLQEVFAVSDVVSIHTALTAETTGMITGAHVSAMKQGATLINTSRGGVIREMEMIEVLRRRPDLTAVLDVTDPEPPVPGSPLYEMENVFLTPHIAGSVGNECRRMGAYAVKELENYIAGKPPIHGVTLDMLRTMA